MKSFHSIPAVIVLILTTNFASAQFEQGAGGSATETRNQFKFQDGESFNIQFVDGKVFTTTAPKNPVKGPTDIFVYENDKGKWKIATINPANPTLPTGSAKYRWEGEPQNDDLVYLGYGNVVENDGNFIDKGSKVAVWAYLAFDSDGDQIFFYLGVDEIRPAPRPGRRVYPMYFSHQSPASGNAVPRRVLTASGTRRK